jgi:N-methylhydantoinase B
MSEADTITGEVIRSALAVAVEEASIVVVRASHSTFIQEGADACAALLDIEGGLVAQSMATSLMHGSSLRCSLPALLEDVPLDRMRPGDVFAMNDPYRGGIHANDLIIFRPIFSGGPGPGPEPGGSAHVVLFAGTLIHVADLGGVAAGGLASLATDTFAEGMLLPPVRLYAEGEQVTDIARIIARNSRAPSDVMGDVAALVAGVNVAAARVDELLDRHGEATVARVIDGYLDYTERRMRAELQGLPSGTYTGSFTIDSDGLDAGRTFDVVVTATVGDSDGDGDGDGEISLDFAGTSPQSRGAINSSLSQTLSGVMFAVRCFVDPTIPMNEGCFRPVRVTIPEGTVANPRPPAACGGRVVTVAAAIEAILGAFSAARADLAVASSGLVHVLTLAGASSPADSPGRGWLTMLYEFGGIGARHGSDGPDATGAFYLGGRSTIPQVEPIEAQHPLRVVRSALRTDSGGAGTWRGGLGVELAIEVLDDVTVSVRGDRMLLPPPGRDGGLAGGAGYTRVDRSDGTSDLLAPRQSAVHLRAGDVLVVATSGGGGLGDPRARAPELVAADVAEGRVSPAAAAEIYGRPE